MGKPVKMDLMASGYAGMLPAVAQDCIDFVTEGKGAERHGHGRKLEDQPWLCIERQIPGFCLAQTAKKVMEANQMEDRAAKIREIRGAVGYALLWLAKQEIEE